MKKGKLLRTKHFRLLTSLSLFFLSLFSAYTFYHVRFVVQKLDPLSKLHKPFPIDSLRNCSLPNPEWEVANSPEVVNFVHNFLLRQKFYWLGRGHQTNVYLSKDGEYVLKLLPQIQQGPPPLGRGFIKFFCNQRFREGWHRKMSWRERAFSAAKLCYEECPEETGILYLHLNRTERFLSSIKLWGPGDSFWQMKGDQLSFLIQQKADYVVPTFQRLMAEGKLEEAKKRLEQLFALLYSMAAKGCIGEDENLILGNNIGFTKERAICIDIGAVVKREEVNLRERMRYEFDERVSPLRDWFRIRYPVLADHYQTLRAQYLS